MLNESKGISDELKNYPEFVYNNYLQNNKGFRTNIYINTLKISDLSIVFTKENSMIDFKFSHLFGDVLHHVIINIKISDERQMKTDISHELTHLLRYYNTELNKDFLLKEEDIKIASKWKKIRISFVNSIDINKNLMTSLNKFDNYIYWSLDDELNARISELYTYLKNSNIKTKSEIENYFKTSDVYEKLKLLQTFNMEDYVSLFEKEEHKKLFKIFNDFIGTLKLLNTKLPMSYKLITSKEQLLKFLKQFQSYIETKILKHYSKCNGIMLELSKDLKLENVNWTLKYLKLFNNFDIDVDTNLYEYFD